MEKWEPRTDLSVAFKCIQAQGELAEQTSQQLQDARAEIARLEEQYQTARDLLEYRSEQYAAMSQVAGEAEAEIGRLKEESRVWEKHGMVEIVTERNELKELLHNRAKYAAGLRAEINTARRWAKAWKQSAKSHRGRNAFFEGAAWKNLAELSRLRKPQPCGHPGACIRVGESWGDGNVHSCAWCEDVARLNASIEMAYAAAQGATREACAIIAENFEHTCSCHTETIIAERIRALESTE